MKELATKEGQIRSNGIEECVECGVQITEANDSGWERFLGDGTTTQKVCVECDNKSDSGKKAE